MAEAKKASTTMPPDKKEIRFRMVVVLLFLLTALTIWLIYSYELRKLEDTSITIPSDKQLPK